MSTSISNRPDWVALDHGPDPSRPIPHPQPSLGSKGMQLLYYGYSTSDWACISGNKTLIIHASSLQLNPHGVLSRMTEMSCDGST